MRLIIAGSRAAWPHPTEIDAALAPLAGTMFTTHGTTINPVDGSVMPTMHARRIGQHVVDSITDVISGGARGADLAGEQWAEDHDLKVVRFPVTDEAIKKHGKYLAPKLRNRDMADAGDLLVAFWDGLSGGTADMIARMVARRKPAIVVRAKRVPAAQIKAERAAWLAGRGR